MNSRAIITTQIKTEITEPIKKPLAALSLCLESFTE